MKEGNKADETLSAIRSGDEPGLVSDGFVSVGFVSGDSASGPTTIDGLMAQMAAADATRKAPSSVRQRLQGEIHRRAHSDTPPPTNAGNRRWAWPIVAAAALIATWMISPVRYVNFARSFAGFSQWSKAQLHPDSRKAESIAEVATTDDATSDTFDLPYSDPSIANGTGAIVRVSLPDSELLAWGVPSHGGEPDDLIPVDLMLGDDGLPQAVRLLPAVTTTSEETNP